MLQREVRTDELFSHNQFPQDETREAIRKHLEGFVRDSGNSGRGYTGFAELGIDALTRGGGEALAKIYEQNFGIPPHSPLNLQGINIICESYLVGIIEASKHSLDLLDRVRKFQEE